MKSRTQWVVIAASVLFVGTAALAAEAPRRNVRETQRASAPIVVVQQDDTAVPNDSAAPVHHSGAQVQNAGSRRQKNVQGCGDEILASFAHALGFTQFESACGGQ